MVEESNHSRRIFDPYCVSISGISLAWLFLLKYVFFTDYCAHSVIAASIVYIIYIRQLKFDNDFLHNVWLSMIFKETVQTTSIMTACIPFLKPFLMSLESGFMRSDDVNRRTGSVTDDGGKNTGLKSSYIKLRNQRSWSNSPRSPVTT